MNDPWCAVAQVESNWKYASSRGGQGAGEEGLYMCFVRPWQDDALISWVDVFKATMFVAVGRRVQATCAAIASLRHSAFSSKRARACLFCSCRRCNSSRSLSSSRKAGVSLVAGLRFFLSERVCQNKRYSGVPHLGGTFAIPLGVCAVGSANPPVVGHRCARAQLPLFPPSSHPGFIPR